MFNPQEKYLITTEEIKVLAFDKYAEKYITRPPYQRKSVWSKRKQQALFDSLFRKFPPYKFGNDENHLKTRAKPNVQGEVKDRYIEREMWDKLENPKYVKKGGILSLMVNTIIGNVLMESTS